MKNFKVSMGCVIALAVCFLGFNVQESHGYPEPSIVPKSWDLDFKVTKSDTIRMRLPGQDEKKLFYYITYTVTNKTGKDQMFIPVASMFTNRGHLLTSGRGVHPAVFKEIKKRLDNPLLMSPTQVVGKILQGRDHAKDGVFIWPVPEDKDIDLLRVFISGLSGESYKAKDPVTDQEYTLWKTIMLEYRTPGDQKSTPLKTFVKQAEHWIMR